MTLYKKQLLNRFSLCYTLCGLSLETKLQWSRRLNCFETNDRPYFKKKDAVEKREPLWKEM